MGGTGWETQEKPGHQEPDVKDLGWRSVGFDVVTLLLVFELREVRSPRKSGSCSGRGSLVDRLGMFEGVYLYPAEQKPGLSQIPRGK